MDNKTFTQILRGNISGPILKIAIEGTIGEGNNTAEYISKRIEGMMCTPACIIVEICSTGGLVDEAIKIYDVLDNAVMRGILVKTFCYGYVASAATVVAQAASPGERHISNESLYLIHKCVVGDEEMTAEECSSMAMTLRDRDEWLVKLYGEKCQFLGEDGARLLMSENGGRGRWLDYKEAIAFNLADEVCEISNEEVIDNVVMPIVDHSYLVIVIIVSIYIFNLMFDATSWIELLLVTCIVCIAIGQILTLKKLLKDNKDNNL